MALRDIYASADGFQDADDNALTVEVIGLHSGDTLADLEESDYFNPFSEDDYDRWVNRQDVLAAIKSDGDASKDSTTGKRTIELGGDFKGVDRVPDGSTYDLPMANWEIAPWTSTTFGLLIEIDPALDHDLTDLHEHPDIIAMEQWLRDLNSGAGMTGDVTYTLLQSTLASWRNLVYSFDQDTSSTTSTVEFRITNWFSVVYETPNDNSTPIIAYQIPCATESSSAAYDDEMIETLFDQTDVSVDVDDRRLQAGFLGGDESLIRGKRLYLGHNQEYLRRDMNGHIVHYFRDPDGTGRNVVVSGDYGRSIHVGDLSVASGDTYPRVPHWPYVNEVHLSEDATADADIQLALPDNFVGAKDNDRAIKFHNPNDTYKLNLRDWDGNVFFTLQPGERAQFAMTQAGQGAGEFVSIAAPNRHLLFNIPWGDFQSDTLTTLNLFKRLDLTDPRDVYGHVFPLPSAAADYTFLHDDFFELGTGTYTDDLEIQNQTTEANAFMSGAFKITGDITGFMDSEIYFLQRKSASSGSMTNPRIRILIFRDGAWVNDYADEVMQNIWVEDERVPQLFIHRGRVQKDDVLLPVFELPSGHSLATSDTQNRHLTMDFTVEPQISLEYSP